MKFSIFSLIGAMGSFFAMLLGGWDTSVITLLIFMAIDFVTGLVVGGIFHKSTKTKTGALESRAGWKGLIKKCVTLLFVVIAVRLDLLIGSSYIRDGVCIAFICNELLSIIENAGLMGIPIPDIIKNAIDILKTKEGDENE